jgi:beta-glucosidase-like glycosyl hydrolase
VIIISDHGLREDAIQALNAGVDYWFDKANIDLEHLLEKTLDLAQVLPSADITRILSAIPDHD